MLGLILLVQEIEKGNASVPPDPSQTLLPKRKEDELSNEKTETSGRIQKEHLI